MKYSFSIFFLLVFFMASANGQQVIREYYESVSEDKENERENRKEMREYKYDEVGQKVEKVKKRWDKDLGIYIEEIKEEWGYKNGHETREEWFKWQPETNSWSYAGGTTYQLNDLGCLLFLENTVFLNAEIETIAKIKYINNYDCNIPWKSKARRPYVGSTHRVKRSRMDSIELEEIFDKPTDLLPSWYIERIYNDQGQLVRSYNNYTDSSYEIIIKEYNDDNTLSKAYLLLESRVYGTVELNHIISYDYLYEEDLLVEEVATTTLYSLDGTESSYSSTYTYDYYCDGLLKRKQRKREGISTNSLETTTYEYDTTVNCDLEETTDFSVYPNPYTEFLIIESDLLQHEQTVVNIYSWMAN